MIPLTKEEAIAARKEFFEEALTALRTPPQKIDEALDQVQYYLPPLLNEDLVIDPVLGDFFVVIDPVLGGKKWPLAYSMWQTGENLKIALVFENEADLTWDWGAEEFQGLWPDAPPAQVLRRAHKTFFEWSFDVPGFHQNYAARERFALGLRHMHFRTLKALRGVAERLRESQMNKR